MAGLYNTTTRQREDINDPEKLHDAILKGTHTFKKGTKVVVTDQDGEQYDLPAEQVQDAIGRGFKVETDNQRQIREYVKENEGLSGDVKAFIGSAVNEFALGIPDLVAKKAGDPLEAAKTEALRDQHDFASSMGSATGFGSSLFYGGPVWKAGSKVGQATTKYLTKKLATETTEGAAKSAAKNLMAKAGGAGVEGLIGTAPVAATEAMLGDPGQAAETLLAGLGVGGFLGGSGAMLKSFGKVAKETETAQKMRDLFTGDIKANLSSKADELAVEALGPKLKHYKKDLKSLSAELDDEWGTIRVEDDVRKIGRDVIESGALDGLPSKAKIADRLRVTTGDLKAQVAKKFDALDATYGDSIKIQGADLVGEVEELFQKNDELLQSAYKKEMRAFIKNEWQDMAALGPMSLRELNKEKAAWQNKLNARGALPTLDESARKAFTNLIPQAMNNAIRKRTYAIDKNAAKDLIETQTKLGNLSKALKVAEDASQSSSANNDFGLTSFVTGMGGLAYGGLDMAIIGLAGREFVRKHGDNLASKILDRSQAVIFAEQAMKRAAIKMDELPKTMQRIQKGRDNFRAFSSGTLARLMGEPDRDRDFEERLEVARRFVEKVETLVANPAYMENQMAGIGGVFETGGAPNIGAEVTMQYQNLFQYIAEIAPTIETKTPLNPYPQEPSTIELSMFEQQMLIIEDPFRAFDELAAGTLTPKQVETLERVYPKIYALMRNRVIDLASQPGSSFDYDTRLNLSMLLDIPLEPSLKDIAAYQAMNEEGAEEGFGAEVDIAGQVETPLQGIGA